MLVFSLGIHAQDIEFKKGSIRTGIGVGYNEGLRENGIGLVYAIGWQKSYGQKNKFRMALQELE